MFSFTPKSEEEITKSGLLEKGEYDFVVKSAQIKPSKSSGKPMVELVLGVWDKEGREHTIFDYLVDAIEYKIRHFCYSVGLGDKYEAGGFYPEESIGKNGLCKVFIKEDKSGQYPPKNSIADYLQGKKEMKTNPKQEEEFKDDDVPF